MNLPEAFINKYENLLGDEAQAFFQTFEQPAESGFRINPLKAALPDFPQPIPGTPWGHYGKVSGKSLEHVAGLVYSQEPAAQVVGQIAQPSPGMRVLDLAAAPGGKSTHLLSYLQNTGLLVANEISKKRSKILVENIERFGARNAIVTNESPGRLARVFPSYFDLIVLDAPCSGEGMFRKDPEAAQYWSETYPAECAQLQREILTEAVKMLAPGGRLVYSTCTWSPEENEAVISWLLETYPDFHLLDISKQYGLKPGIRQPETVRLYPHHFRGEGQFVAHLQDRRPIQTASRIRSGKSNLTKLQQVYWEEFVDHQLKIKLSGLLQVFGSELYLLPDGLPDLSKLRLARNGLHLGTFKKKRFEPSFALGIALRPDEVKQKVILPPSDFAKYVAGEALNLPQSYPNGWYQLTIKGNGLGFVKLVGNTLKNNYPKGLRFK